MNYYSDEYLEHFGVKGMKWGVRRALKKEAKKQYRNAKADARNSYIKKTDKADRDYDNAMSKQNKALEGVNKKYALKQKTIDAQYKSEIDKHQRKVDDAKRDMDFWGEDSSFHQHYADKHAKASKDLDDAQSRYDAATYANKVVRDQAAIKVRDLYYKQSEKATATKEAAYAKAGADYVESLNLAKQTYKEAKRNIKKKGAL